MSTGQSSPKSDASKDESTVSGWSMVALDAVPPVPWRNGGGLTRELLAWPSLQDWQWRVSVADITQDGAFSVFEGVDRWFAVLEGEGVELTSEGGELAQRQTVHSAPLYFDGSWPVFSRLHAGATRDLNLMVRRERFQATMLRVNDVHVQPVVEGSVFAVFAFHEGAGLSLGPAAARVALPARTLAWRAFTKSRPGASELKIEASPSAPAYCLHVSPRF